MKSQRRLRPRLHASCLVLTLMACVIATPAMAQDRLPGRALSDRPAWQPMVERIFTLRDLGFSTPINFSGIDMGQEIFFPVPGELKLRSAQISLAGNYLRSEIGSSSFVSSVNGRPNYLHEPKDREGTYSRTFDVVNEVVGRPGGFLALGLRYSSTSTGNSCDDRRSIGNIITIAPESNFSYVAPAADVVNVRTAWRMLPQSTRILVPQWGLTVDEYRGALSAALAIAATGRKPVFVNVPEVGDIVSGVAAALPPELARSRVFAKFSDPQQLVRIDSAAERAAFALLNSARGQAPYAETAIGYEWLRDMMMSDINALRIAVGPLAPILDSYFAAGLTARDLRPEDNLKVATVFGQPMIFFDSANASEAAGFLGGSWSELAQAANIDIRYAGDRKNQLDWIPLSDLAANLNSISIVDYGEWVVNLTAERLPANRWPTVIEIDARISPDETDVTPVLSVMMNDVLLRAERVSQDGEMVRLRVDIPGYLLASSNTIRIAVQRGAGDCRAFFSRGYKAQIMPTSRVVLSSIHVDKQFFGLKSFFADRAMVTLPKAYLENPLSSLAYVYPFVRALGITPTSLHITTLEAPGDFAPTGPFVVFGAPLPGLLREISTEGGRLKIESSQASGAIDLLRDGNLAVAYLTQVRDHIGVAINTVTGTPASDVKVEGLNVGDMAIFGPSGQVMVLGAEEFRITGLRSAFMAPAAIFSRHGIWIASGLTIILLLVFMSVLRTVIARRKKAKEGAAVQAQPQTPT